MPSSYPKFCDCCETPVLLKSKQLKQYHINKMSKANNKRKLDAVEVQIESDFLAKNMEMFLNAVRNTNDMSELSIILKNLQLQIDEAEREFIKSECESLSANLVGEYNKKFRVFKEKYDNFSESEKCKFKDLSSKDSTGHYNFSVRNLTEQKNLLLNRIEGIDIEIAKRENELPIAVYDFIAKAFSKERTPSKLATFGDSQDF